MRKGFEDVFARFVESIGGEVIPQGPEESADFLFRGDQVIVELKTLLQDATPEHVRKLGVLAEKWNKLGPIRIYGTAVLDLQKIRKECQDEWLDLLEAPVERLIRKANSQIRSTRITQGLLEAKGLLLICNDGNLLHLVPKNFMITIARILKKRDESGALRFPEIRSVVYFSYRLPAAGESALFWYGGIVDEATDLSLEAFNERLGREWFAYFSKLSGIEIRQIPDPLEGQIG